MTYGLSFLCSPFLYRVQAIWINIGHGTFVWCMVGSYNVDTTSNDSSLADSSSMNQSPWPSEEDQPVSYRLQRRRVSEDRHTNVVSSLPGSTEEQAQLTVLTRHGRKVKPTPLCSSVVWCYFLCQAVKSNMA